MIKYGLDTVAELKFSSFEFRIERRDEQWVDIYLQPGLEEETPVPSDMIAFTIWVICTHDGTVVQMLPQDEDCDCEYGFTVGEKEQIAAFIASEAVQSEIANLTSP
ncbi:hypothetical protein [Paenibacillus agaridevorans]|uniref:hypothetical protein n=1 Tax=Paenibacillus agaridevorans TaxID=171404 RepID=UPI001BE43D69|nr:hypothetical protein [Paenibacillus agaridevorans]